MDDQSDVNTEHVTPCLMTPSQTPEETGVTEDSEESGEGSIDSELRFKRYMEEWKNSAKERPLRVLVCGLGGVGKSTLISHLLKLADHKESDDGAAKSMVLKYEKTTQSGIKVCLFDTPGFDDLDLSREELIAMMENETEKELDIVFYCISLNGPARVQQEDVKALKVMTQAFSSEIWKKAVIVLTFANALEERVKRADEYERVITRVKENVKQILRKEACVHEEITSALPIVSAGYTEPILKYEAEDCLRFGGWDNHLFLEALKQVDPAALPALFEVRYDWQDLRLALGHRTTILTGVSGMVIGAMAGASTGIGIVGGALVGAGIGASVGVVRSSGVGPLKFQLHKITSILKIKYEKWRNMERYSKTPSKNP